MNKSKFLATWLVAWLVIEILVFVLIAEFIGLVPAILLGLATTALGLADVKRLLLYIRARLSKPGENKPGGLVDGGLQALGSFLLLLPGFVSDLAGLALKSPSIRAGLAERIRTGSPKRNGPPTIDLSPNEWKTIQHKRRAPRVGPKSVGSQSVGSQSVGSKPVTGQPRK